jgi:SM-20-related protein
LNTQISTIIDDLAKTEYSLIDGLFSEPDLESLNTLFAAERLKGAFRAAKIAGLDTQLLETKIRSDLIHWLTAADFASLDLKSYADFFVTFTLALNRELFLNIDHHDLHFSFYPLGAFYSAHLDQPRRKDNRKITFIHYLNRDWKAGDGGELRLYLDDAKERFIDIEPIWGRTLFFVSDRFYHEVRPSSVAARHSLTGWFSVAGNPLNPHN